MEVLHYFGAALGLGMIVIGAALGIGKFAPLLPRASHGSLPQPQASLGPSTCRCFCLKAWRSWRKCSCF